MRLHSTYCSVNCFFNYYIIYIFLNQQTHFYNMFAIIADYPIVDEYARINLLNPFCATFWLFPVFIKHFLGTKSLNRSYNFLRISFWTNKGYETKCFVLFLKLLKLLVFIASLSSKNEYIIFVTIYSNVWWACISTNIVYYSSIFLKCLPLLNAVNF